MKHGKRPTKAQKIRIKQHGLNPDNWLVITDHNGVFLIVNKISSKTKSLK